MSLAGTGSPSSASGPPTMLDTTLFPLSGGDEDVRKSEGLSPRFKRAPGNPGTPPAASARRPVSSTRSAAPARVMKPAAREVRKRVKERTLASTMSLSMPRGPRVVATTLATARQDEMLDRSWGVPCDVSVPSADGAKEDAEASGAGRMVSSLTSVLPGIGVSCRASQLVGYPSRLGQESLRRRQRRTSEEDDRRLLGGRGRSARVSLRAGGERRLIGR